MTQQQKFIYPSVKREDLCEIKFDTQVPDPYRYLEDPDSAETKQFVDAQNAITNPYLEQCPHRQKIKELLTKNQDYPRQGCFFKRGNKYYFYKNSGLQQQAVLYQQDTLDSEPRVFLDPNELSDDGTVSLNQIVFSPDGNYLAFATSKGGSDWIEIKIIDITTGKELPERLTRAKFTHIDWTHDNKGFFYASYPSNSGPAEGTTASKNENHQLHYHYLGTGQDEDVMRVDFPSIPTIRIYTKVSEDGKFLNVFGCKGCNDVTWHYSSLIDLDKNEKLQLNTIYDKFDTEFDYVSNDGDIVYFKTNHNSKNYKICKLNITKPSTESWVDIIENHPTDVLDWAEVYSVKGKNYMLIHYTHNVASQLELRSLEGELLKNFDISPGTISKVAGRQKHDEFFFHFTSFLSPGKVYHFDLNNLDKEPQLVAQSNPKNFNPDEFQIEQIFYASKDGTKIPMFIVSRKDVLKDGSNPCILYGYGGFNIKLNPNFNINRITWLKNFRGILAVPNIRGGGEFGKEWYDGGRLLNKQNVFDDFACAAEYLINNKYTCRDKLAIEGGSNGGLLVAAVSNQRPDLFGATLCHVGVLDMIRFVEFTVGAAWICDYGDPNEKEHFENLIRYSPYHNIPDDVTRYPSTLLLTADHDDRVVPAHSLKFIAELQHKLSKKLSETPLLIRVDTKAGHGGGKPTSKIIEQYTDMYSFLYNSLHLDQHFSAE